MLRRAKVAVVMFVCDIYENLPLATVPLRSDRPFSVQVMSNWSWNVNNRQELDKAGKAKTLIEHLLTYPSCDLWMHLISFLFPFPATACRIWSLSKYPEKDPEDLLLQIESGYRIRFAKQITHFPSTTYLLNIDSFYKIDWGTFLIAWSDSNRIILHEKIHKSNKKAMKQVKTISDLKCQLCPSRQLFEYRSYLPFNSKVCTSFWF